MTLRVVISRVARLGVDQLARFDYQLAIPTHWRSLQNQPVLVSGRNVLELHLDTAPKDRAPAIPGRFYHRLHATGASFAQLYLRTAMPQHVPWPWPQPYQDSLDVLLEAVTTSEVRREIMVLVNVSSLTTPLVSTPRLQAGAPKKHQFAEASPVLASWTLWA